MALRERNPACMRTLEERLKEIAKKTGVWRGAERFNGKRLLSETPKKVYLWRHAQSAEVARFVKLVTVGSAASVTELSEKHRHPNQYPRNMERNNDHQTRTNR